LNGVDDGICNLLSSGAIFTLDTAATDEYRDIINSLDGNSRGVRAIELILRQLRLLSASEYKRLDTVRGGKLYDAVTALVEDRASVMFIPDGHHLPDTMLKLYCRAVPLKRLVAVSDA
jgi:hypothetical protein